MGKKSKKGKKPEQSDTQSAIDAVEIQTELPSMPPRSPVGQAAIKYRDICEEMKDTVEKLKTKKGKACDTLIEEMKKIEKDSVNVDGYVFIRKHIEEDDRIEIKKPKIAG